MVLFYVDDSGDERLTTFSAIGVPVERWNEGLACWLGWRRRLQNDYGVDVDYRLHANEWVAGRGRPAKKRCTANWTSARGGSLRILGSAMRARRSGSKPRISSRTPHTSTSLDGPTGGTCGTGTSDASAIA
jgi:hypothetical protein